MDIRRLTNKAENHGKMKERLRVVGILTDYEKLGIPLPRRDWRMMIKQIIGNPKLKPSEFEQNE